jgi:hypothetical protein
VKIEAAVRELDTKFGDRIEVEILSAKTEEGQAAAEKYDFGGPAHGLVAFGPDGKVGFTMPGHFYTREDIELDLEEFFGLR